MNNGRESLHSVTVLRGFARSLWGLLRVINQLLITGLCMFINETKKSGNPNLLLIPHKSSNRQPRQTKVCKLEPVY